MAEESLFDPKADSPLSDSVLRAKRQRYQGFDADSVVRKIVQDSLGTAVEKIEQLGVGANAFDHLVFRVHTADGREVICRINADALIATHFAVEAALYKLWRDAGVPSPEVYNVTLRGTPKGFDYMLLESVGTTDLEQFLTQHHEQALEYARASGAFLARLHNAPVSGFGMLHLAGGALAGEQATWRDAITLRLEETLSHLVQHQLLTQEHTGEITSAFARHDSLLNLEQGVTLHGDYHNANIIVDESERAIMGAIDLSQAKAGDPLYDIAFYGTYVNSEICAAFCEGYFAQGERPQDFEKKMALYQLRIYLSKAKLRKRFGYEERIPAAIEGALRALRVLS